MIDVKELRVGNWVDYKGNHCIWDEDDFGEVNYGILDFTNPIELTEDWLIKFGFQGNYIQLEELQITHEMDGYYLADDNGIGVGVEYIKHIHQLQNLYFALTGEELTIKD